MNILLLGTGLQGKAALHDLVQSESVSQVVAADANIDDLIAYVDKLNTDKVRCVHLDARDQQQVAELMQSVEAVIGLLPSDFRLPLVQLAVANGIHWVDASYALPEFEALGSQAAAKGVTILPEFGLDPGIDLVLAGQAIKELDEIQGFFSYGSGVPEPAVADNPLKYKISWTFAGVLRSYQRPARVLRGGQAVDIPANEIFADENVHTLEISGLGKMEAYPNGDVMKYLQLGGLSETVQSAGRYALRWPGHCAFWKKMVDLGFLDETPFKVGDCAVSPQQFVHDLLEPQLHYREGERDVVVVGVDVRGLKGGQKRRIVYQVVDWRDRKTGLLAMQRTVGYTASIGAQMILRGDIQKRGLLSPLTDISSDKFFAELGQRGITVQREEQLEKFGSS